MPDKIELKMINYKEKLHDIKAFVFDFDGVMTNGDVWTYGDGETVRCGNIKDGFAIQYAVKRGYIEAVLSTQSIIDASYAIRKEQYEEAFFKTVIWACDHINIASIDTFNLLAAVKSRSGDFEDDAQYDCALANYCDFFVTSDKKLLARHGNSHPKLTLCTPAEFFERLKSEA